MSRYYKTTLQALGFQCTAKQCPKHQDSVVVPMLAKRMRTSFARDFNPYGCAQFRTFVYGIAPEPCSPEDFEKAPLIGVILPSPDPSGAQGAASGFGFSRDVIFESLLAAPHAPKAIRVAIMYLTRGYSFKNVSQGELVNMPVSPAAIAHCLPFLKKELAEVKPDRLLLCGYEVANTFMSGMIQLANNRRMMGLHVTIDGVRYPAQITYNPHFTSIVPPVLASIREDCEKLFHQITPLPRGKAVLLDTLDKVIDYLDWLEQHDGYCSLDYETENLNRKAPNRLGTIQFATDEQTGYVIPYEHHQTPFDPFELKVIRKRLIRLFRDKNKLKGWIIHNAKFEQTRTKVHFGTFIGSAPIYDTQAMAFLQDETRSERKVDIPPGGGIFSLKQLSRDLLGFDGYSKGALAARSEGTLIDLPLVDLADYGAMDVWVTMALFRKLREVARAEHYEEQMMRLARLFYDPATRLIAHVEMAGFKTRLRYVRELAAKKGPFELRLEELESAMKTMQPFKAANDQIAKDRNGGAIRGVMGTPWLLDLAKPDHQRLIFLDTMNLEPVSWSEKTGKPAIDDEFFEAYAGSPGKEATVQEYTEVRLFSQFMETKKMKDAFVTKTLERTDPETGDPDCRLDQRIRPDIHYSRLVTGRWTPVKPNMAQIPRADDKTENETDFKVKKAVKDIFTCDTGCGLLQFDYKVNEVRWAAILSGDKALAKIFIEAAELTREARATGDEELLKKADLYEDVHKGTASMMFKIAREIVTKAQRQISKTITFGLLFQQSAKALAESVGITIEEAEAHTATFFSQMKEVDLWIRRMKYEASMNHFVEAPDGRRRRFWGFRLPDSCPNKRSHTGRNERQAVNSPIQGIASGAAMVGGGGSLLRYIEQHDKPWLIQNLVHDSCLVQVPLDDVEEAFSIAEDIFVKQAMERMEEMGVRFNLPLGVDAEGGVYWGSLSKWDGSARDAKRIVESIRTHWAAQ